MITEKEIFERFKGDSNELVETLNEYDSVCVKLAECEQDLGNSYLVLNEKFKLLKNAN